MSKEHKQYLSIAIVVGFGFGLGDQLAWLIFDVIKTVLRIPLGWWVLAKDLKPGDSYRFERQLRKVIAVDKWPTNVICLTLEGVEPMVLLMATSKVS